MVKAEFSVIIQNNPVAYTGSMVSGHISVEVQQEIQGSSLSVEFYGKEKTCVRYTTSTSDGKGGTTTTTHYAHGQRNLIRISLQLDHLEHFIQNGRVQPGRYALPFQFSLPSDLPSSFVYTTGSEYAKIQYKVKASLAGSGWIKDYQCESHVPISSCRPLAPVPFQGQPSTSAVNLCCCWNRGSMTLGAHMDTTIIGKGQQANVAFACRNNSTAKVEYVRACLMQQMTWHASGHTQICSIQLCTAMFPITGDLEASTKEEKNRQRSVESVRDENLSILEELRTGKNTRPVSVPLNAISSYVGGIIQVSHYLKLEVKTGCCIDNPTVHIPILCCDAPATTQQTATLASTETQSTVPSAPTEPIDSYEPAEFVYAEPISVGASHTILGKPASLGGEEAEIHVPPPMVNATSLDDEPSLDILLREMKNSVGEISLVQQVLNDAPAWQSFFASLSPTQFALIVSSVQSSFDETGMAVLLAQSITSFSCEHVVQVVRKASEFSRTNLVEKLLLYCNDFVQNHEQIEAVLTEWERSVTERAFEKELERRQR